MTMRRLLAAMTVLLGLAGFAPQARANLLLGVGASGNFGLGDRSVELPRSYTLDGILGYRIDVEPLELTPELEVIYLGSIDTAAGERSGKSFQVMGGGRLGYRHQDVVPSLFLHFGIGNLAVSSSDVAARETGPAVEAGAAFDVWIRNELSLGVHVGASAMRLADFSRDDFDLSWLRAGVRLAIAF